MLLLALAFVAVATGNRIADDFNPPAGNDQYLIQTGFSRIFNAAAANVIPGKKPAQKYVSINNRDATADLTDHYPEMWEQLKKLPKSPEIAP